MATNPTHAVPNGHSFAEQSLRWLLFRLGVYAIAAVSAVALFSAGAAFYTYVWPGVSQAEFVPTSTPVPAPPPTVPLPPLTPTINPHNPEPALVKNNELVVVAALPTVWNVIGVPVVDDQNSPVGNVIGVEIDPQAAQQGVIITLLEPGRRAVIFVPTRYLSWEGKLSEPAPKKATLPFGIADLSREVDRQIVTRQEPTSTQSTEPQKVGFFRRWFPLFSWR